MARPRIYDPAGVSDNPVCVTDPAREAELVDELRKRLEYVKRHYLFVRSLTHLLDYNSSLAQVKKTLAGKPGGAEIARLNIDIQLAIGAKAREFAQERGISSDDPISAEDRKRALQWVASTLKPIRGRPRDEVLDRTVAGLMALVQEYSGRPVMAGKTLDYCEKRHLRPGVSQVLLLLQDIDPSINEKQLANIVFRMRRKYKGLPMRFADFLPGYSSRPLRIVFHAADGGRNDGARCGGRFSALKVRPHQV